MDQEGISEMVGEIPYMLSASSLQRHGMLEPTLQSQAIILSCCRTVKERASIWPDGLTHTQEGVGGGINQHPKAHCNLII